ncbi:MAG: ABC transporter permease [Candidatus Reconcilbacillus cellulovorans]|uniref:ABC transporter permease n=1 Tax=Candidatus Reconcilbacillus cellulovorans TaxID=1906605 RepID=A0A2A6E1N1_9BACL|nr:MAG: ABC transporter permease [Candidatus Reconcilbacillus cellulovorans]
MTHDRTWSTRLFDAVNYSLLFLIAAATILPFLHVVAGSFTTAEELAVKKFVLFPSRFSLDAYLYIFSTNTVMRGMLVSVCVTVFGTLFSVFLTSLMAYGLGRRDLVGRRPLMFLVVFTMLFSGGMIPTFIVVKALGMIDSYLALVVPSSISAFNLIILRNFFMNLPEGLEESAKIDGCGDFRVLFQIVIPLSMPAIATIALFYAVTYWNTYLPAILYLNDATKWPIQVILRQIVILASGLSADTTGLSDDFIRPPEQTIKMAVIVVATIPVLLVYPFLQKHFVKGALLGAIKG